ncbi:protein croquemort-like [Hetaerina americana]|uniref:protein croquemort-like n=1 Tax=Hetaerina americana TaxID=62018 RepID=UPI003A7F52B5
MAEMRCGIFLRRFLFVVGVVLCIGGGLAIYYWPSTFSAIIEQNVILSEGSDSHKLWMEAPMKLTMLYHFFNLTNPEDITNPSKKLNFVEMGPYAFTQRIEKENVTWDSENGTVTFIERNFYYFDPELSKGSLDDRITSLSIPAVMAAHKSQDWNFLSRKGLSIAIGRLSTITSTHTAGELMFEGYEDPLFDLADTFPSDEPVPERFGWFFEFNGTSQETTFTMDTGEKDIRNIGRLWKFDGMEETGFFDGECGKVRGSAGHMWAPKLKKTNITLFIESLCRSVTLPFSGETTVEGIPAYKFTGDRRFVDNGTLDESSSCFCGADGNDCLPVGGLNMSVCHRDTPVVVTFPHFYLADPWYTENITGMTPDPEKHSFYMSLEPTAGYPIDVRARTQVNVYLKPSSHISLFNKVREVIFPIMWAEGRAVMTPKLLGLTEKMVTGESLGMMACIATVAIGALLILVSLILCWISSRRGKREVKRPPVERGPAADPLMGTSSIPHGNKPWTELQPISGGFRYTNGNTN